jgi:curved DNA-binding protein CbpA
MAFPIKQGLFQFADLIDHYAVLGAPMGADNKEIRQRYLAVARILHPDTCKLSTNTEKTRANQLLSKLVNPSWENLSKEHSRQEFRLSLTQIGRELSQNWDKVTFKSEVAQKLLQAGKKGKNPELEYRSLLKPLTDQLYTSVDNVYRQIGDISELNLAYLILVQGKISGSQETNPAPVPPSPIQTAEPIYTTGSISTPPPNASEPEKSKETATNAYIRRAQDYIEQKNYAQAVLELRDVIKIEPNNSTGHGLLGLAYLRQNQLSMARVHINTALKYNPQDSIAYKAKEELEKVDPKSQDKSSNTSKKTQSGGGFWGLFGAGGKKN